MAKYLVTIFRNTIVYKYILNINFEKKYLWKSRIVDIFLSLWITNKVSLILNYISVYNIISKRNWNEKVKFTKNWKI